MPDLNRTFAALSDVTRRAIVARLAQGEAPLSDLAAPFEMSLTAVSKHVRVLSDAGSDGEVAGASRGENGSKSFGWGQATEGLSRQQRNLDAGFD